MILLAAARGVDRKHTQGGLTVDENMGILTPSQYPGTAAEWSPGSWRFTSDTSMPES